MSLAKTPTGLYIKKIDCKCLRCAAYFNTDSC